MLQLSLPDGISLRNTLVRKKVRLTILNLFIELFVSIIAIHVVE